MELFSNTSPHMPLCPLTVILNGGNRFLEACTYSESQMTKVHSTTALTPILSMCVCGSVLSVLVASSIYAHDVSLCSCPTRLLACVSLLHSLALCLSCAYARIPPLPEVVQPVFSILPSIILFDLLGLVELLSEDRNHFFSNSCLSSFYLKNANLFDNCDSPT